MRRHRLLIAFVREAIVGQSSVAGLTPQEILHLTEVLREHIVRPEFMVRFGCEARRVAFREEGATERLALRGVSDSDSDRQCDGVTPLGDMPVGVDGCASAPVEGNPICASAAPEAAIGAR